MGRLPGRGPRKPSSVRLLRVLIDTNVLVSAVLFGGVPGAVLEAARSGAVAGLVSLHILGEFRDVLTRPRFGVDAGLTDALAEEIAGFCDVLRVESAGRAWTVDADDDPVVEAAVLGAADVVVTGDAHLLALTLRGLRFITPAALMAELEDRLSLSRMTTTWGCSAARWQGGSGRFARVVSPAAR